MKCTTTSSHGVLTWDDVKRAAERLSPAPIPDWVRMIRDAHEVVVKPAPYIPEEDCFVFDPNLAPVLYGVPMARQPIMVLCAPKHEERVEEVVAYIRGSVV